MVLDDDHPWLALRLLFPLMPTQDSYTSVQWRVDMTPVSSVLRRVLGSDAVGFGLSGNLRKSHELELSVVIPCLNESSTIGGCVTTALKAMESHGIVGEVVVSDNGSTDESVSVATI